jgi:hypothetical protein
MMLAGKVSGTFVLEMGKPTCNNSERVPSQRVPYDDVWQPSTSGY